MLACSNNGHWTAANRILRYVHATLKVVLFNRLSLVYLVLFQMQIGQVALMIEG
jgi:hypothetical protein